jgi:hypothetical protein
MLVVPATTEAEAGGWLRALVQKKRGKGLKEIALYYLR